MQIDDSSAATALDKMACGASGNLLHFPTWATQKKPYYVPLYWLFNRDFFNGNKPYNKGKFFTTPKKPKEPG